MITMRIPSLLEGHDKPNTECTMRDWAKLSIQIESGRRICQSLLRTIGKNRNSSHRRRAGPADPHEPQEAKHSVLKPHNGEEYMFDLAPKAYQAGQEQLANIDTTSAAE